MTTIATSYSSSDRAALSDARRAAWYADHMSDERTVGGILADLAKGAVILMVAIAPFILYLR